LLQLGRELVPSLLFLLLLLLLLLTRVRLSHHR
jgi:hypothetical protein